MSKIGMTICRRVRRGAMVARAAAMMAMSDVAHRVAPAAMTKTRAQRVPVAQRMPTAKVGRARAATISTTDPCARAAMRVMICAGGRQSVVAVTPKMIRAARVRVVLQRTPMVHAGDATGATHMMPRVAVAPAAMTKMSDGGLPVVQRATTMSAPRAGTPPMMDAVPQAARVAI